MPTNESLYRYMSQPEKDVCNVKFSYLLYANDHFTLLRKAVDGDHEPTEPHPRGRPVGTTFSHVLSSTVHSPISHERQRPPTEEEEANEVWEEHDKRTKEEKIGDVDGVVAQKAPKHILIQEKLLICWTK